MTSSITAEIASPRIIPPILSTDPSMVSIPASTPPVRMTAAAGLVGWRRAVAWSAVAAAAVILTGGVLAGMATIDGSVLRIGGMLRADALSAVMLLVIGAVAVIATWAGVSYIEQELATGHTDA